MTCELMYIQPLLEQFSAVDLPRSVQPVARLKLTGMLSFYMANTLNIPESFINVLDDDIEYYEQGVQVRVDTGCIRGVILRVYRGLNQHGYLAQRRGFLNYEKTT
jgi:hypothetical protein